MKNLQTIRVYNRDGRALFIEASVAAEEGFINETTVAEDDILARAVEKSWHIYEEHYRVTKAICRKSDGKI